jgi:hypothetical protein
MRLALRAFYGLYTDNRGWFERGSLRHGRSAGGYIATHHPRSGLAAAGLVGQGAAWTPGRRQLA